MIDRRCGTCRHWKDWQCEHPFPEIPELSTLLTVPIPAAAEITYRTMTANRGTTCQCWAVPADETITAREVEG